MKTRTILTPESSENQDACLARNFVAACAYIITNGTITSRFFVLVCFVLFSVFRIGELRVHKINVVNPNTRVESESGCMLLNQNFVRIECQQFNTIASKITIFSQIVKSDSA